MKTGLVLSGGGARGAYEAGVISYLRDELGPRLGRPVPLDVLCGTSVGAITACALAATAERPADQGRRIRDLWLGLTIGELLELRAADVARAVWELGGGGLVNPAPLRALLRAQVPWPAIGRNLRAHRLSALCVSTTRVSDGKSCLFVQHAPPRPPAWVDDPRLDVAAARIGPRHALASSAMPVLFAPIALGGQLHLDGGLRLNVPISPAVHLGAQRVIVISMQPERARPLAPGGERLDVTAAFLMGKAINALMQDRTEQDIDRLEELNALVASGTAAYGPGFRATIGKDLAARGRHPIRFVRSLVLRPSQDLGVIASEVAASPDFCKRNRQLPGALVALLARHLPGDSADLASYLLFDRAYAEALIALGRADAQSKEAQWVRFFDDAPINAAEADAAP